MIRSARIFGANGHGIFIRFLVGSHNGHVYREQINQVWRETGGGTVADFFIVADVDGRWFG
jgi:hypothetical protein